MPKDKDTVLFLGILEQINNPDFNSIEFEGIKNEAGQNSFYLSAKKWLKATNAKGFFKRNIKFMVQFYNEYGLDASIGKQSVSFFENFKPTRCFVPTYPDEVFVQEVLAQIVWYQNIYIFLQQPVAKLPSECELTRALPEKLRSSLPSIEELEAELGGIHLEESGDE